MAEISTAEEPARTAAQAGTLRRVPQWLRTKRALVEKFGLWLSSTQSPDWFTVISTAMLVGLGAGLGAVMFRWLIETAQTIAFDGGAQAFGFLGDYFFLPVPAIGGLIVGVLVYWGAREAKGHGVPEVMEAVALKGGRIRPRVAVVKSLASSVCIGSGGSVGREGPIVQIGSALGSTIGQVLKLSPERIRSLVACGAAGGISATFNAPIAGSIFALEVILGEMKAHYFGAVVISAVIADVIAHAFEGSVRAFPVPVYELVSEGELILYAGLGILAALTSVIYAKLIYKMEDVFDAWRRFPEYLKPAVGGLLISLIGVVCIVADLTYTRGDLVIPGVFGVGYELIEPALNAELAVGAVLGLLVLKLLATSLTLGSGGSGGVFAPSLFLGAMLGMAFGHVVHSVFPEATAPPGAYALVGMSATFAGAAHAPATAILILFEMTGNYQIILPLMFATVMSMIVSRVIEPESIYTLKLLRRGVTLHRSREVDLLEGVLVAEAMTQEYDSVPVTMGLPALMNEFERTHHHGFTVLDEEGRFYGVVTLTDLEEVLLSEPLEGRTVADIATVAGLAVGYPDETMSVALWRMGVHGIGRLPIVDRADPQRLVGVVRRADIVNAYEQALSRRTDISHQLKELREVHEGDVHVLKFDVTDKHQVLGKTVLEIAQILHEECILVSVRRGKRVIIPHGDTVFQVGDHITVLASANCALDMKQKLKAASS